jgi:hypothetical protein
MLNRATVAVGLAMGLRVRLLRHGSGEGSGGRVICIWYSRTSADGGVLCSGGSDWC